MKYTAICLLQERHRAFWVSWSYTCERVNWCADHEKLWRNRIIKHAFSVLVMAALIVFDASATCASLWGDEVWITFQGVADGGSGPTSIDPFIENRVVNIMDVEVNNADIFMGIIFLTVDINPFNETIAVALSNPHPVGVNVFFIEGIFSDLDWLSPTGAPIAGSISTAFVTTAPFGLSFNVTNTADSITVEIPGTFQVPAGGSVEFEMTLLTQHIPEPTTAALLGLGLICLAHGRRRRRA